MKNKIKKDNLLKVELINDKIIISIGLDALALAVENSPDWLDEWKIDSSNNYKDFGESILRYLNYEEEDGTTLVHTLFDNVALEALEQGSPGFIEVETEDDY